MHRRAFQYAFNLAMVKVVQRSGIPRQLFEVAVLGGYMVHRVRLSAGKIVREYEVDSAKNWEALLLADAAGGVFGPPQSPWQHGTHTLPFGDVYRMSIRPDNDVAG